MSDDHYKLPTPRTMLAARYVRVLVYCRSCHHQRDADQAFVNSQRQNAYVSFVEGEHPKSYGTTTLLQPDIISLL
jgi:hypothetical protein